MALLVDAGLGGALSSRGSVHVYAFDGARLSDPLAKGRLLARLQGSDHVIVVGFEACAWAGRELEDLPVFFAGGLSRVLGLSLQENPRWAGSLSYGADQVLDYARGAGWKRVGVLYTAGFQSVLPALRGAAAARGVRLGERAVGKLADVPGGVSGLMESSDAVMVVGGPRLTAGAGFDFAVERSLSSRIPLIVPEPDLVAAGAFLAVMPDWPRIAASAAELAQAVGRGEDAWPKVQVSLSAGNPQLVFNEVLRRKWSPSHRGPP